MSREAELNRLVPAMWWAYCDKHDAEYLYYSKENNGCPVCESLKRLRKDSVQRLPNPKEPSA